MALILGAAREQLWRYASSVPYSTANSDQIAEFDSTLNRLCQRFLIEGQWRSCFRRVTLPAYGQTLTLPRHFSACIGVDPVCPNGGWSGISLHIYSRMATNGPALTSDSARCCAIRGLVPVSDSAQTFQDPPTAVAQSFNQDVPIPTGDAFYLRAKSTVASGRGITLIGGRDENGDLIQDNVKLEIANGTTTTNQQYTEMPFIEKAVTGASVSFFSVDTTNGETLLAVYEPSETIPAYKRYALPVCNDGDTFNCLCKLAYVPAINDQDLIIPSVVDALILGLMSMQFRDKNDAERSALYMGPNFSGSGDSTAKPVMKGAIDVLDSDLSADEPAEVPMFSMPSDYGAGNIFPGGLGIGYGLRY